MKPIKVVQINKLFFPWIGGIETVVRQLVQGLAKTKEFEVTVLAGNEKKSIKTLQYEWSGAKVYKAGSIGIKFSTPLAPLYPFVLRKLIKENEVFHFHVPNPLGEVSFFFNQIPKHKKVVVTVHADLQQTRWKFFAPIYNFFFKRLLQRADIITTMGPQNIDSFASLAPFKHKCVVVPLAFDETHDVTVTEADKTNFRKQYALDTSKQTIIFVGRLSYYKGISHLLEAVHQLPNTQLIIVGDGQLKSEIIQQIKDLHLENRVVLTGFLQGHPLACAYSVSDLFVLASTTESETFGIVQAEAMKFGLPIINTALPTAVVSVSLNNVTGLTIEPANTLALQEAISIILNNEALRSQFAKNSFERSKLFTPETMVSNYASVYRSAVNI